MAQTDLTGLLTGISSAPIDPRDSMTAQQEMLSRSSEANRGLRRGIGALTGANTQTTKEKAEAALAQLDPSNKADREQILRIVSQINPARVPVLRQAFADKDKADAAASVTSGQAQERLDIQRIQAEASQTSAAASKLAAGGGGKLSVADRNAIRDAETAAAKSRGQVDAALGMAKRYETLKPTGGFMGNTYEAWKSSIGGQDEVSALKTGFTNLVNTGIIGSLPPGVASDKDIEMARSGFPNSSWNADEIASWLRGNAKLQAYQSERSRFEAQWISDNKGDASGWNNAWDELRASEGYAQAVVNKYNLPALDLPKEDLSFDEATFAAIQEKKRQAAQNQAQGRIAGATGGFGL
jgi:hypothetical protein